MQLHTLDWHNWRRVLCVVAHPDDAEYGLSAAVSMWTKAGVEVSYLLLTRGEAGMPIPPEEAGPLRTLEQEAACAEVGVTALTVLDYPDGQLEYGLDLRRSVAREVRRQRPDVVVTANFDVVAYGGLNQSDHRVAGLATIDGARDAANPWLFPELLDDGLEPWEPGLLLVAGAAVPTHAMAIDEDAVAAGVRSLASHREYLAALPWHPKPEQFIPEMLDITGPSIGVERAFPFQVFDLGGIAKTLEQDS